MLENYVIMVRERKKNISKTITIREKCFALLNPIDELENVCIRK